MSKNKTNVERVHVTLAPAAKQKIDRMIESGEAKDISDAVGICIRNYGGGRPGGGCGVSPP